MEAGQCWMWWTKRSYSLSPNLTSSTKTSYDDSWEEQAFAKDAAGTLGGCIWPPRSYSCSFCRREFRSAQALGGHMNVHRRDRARLKQRSSPQNEIPYQELQTLHQNPVPNPSSSPAYRYPSPVPGFAYNTNFNSNPDVLASPSMALDNCIEDTLISSYNSSVLRWENKASSVYSSKFWSNLSEDICTHKFDIIESRESDSVKITKKGDSGSRFEADNYESDEALKFQTKETAIISRKRKRTDASSIEFFPKSSSIDQHDDMQSEMFESSPVSSMEEVDLELRLGHSPKVELHTQ